MLDVPDRGGSVATGETSGEIVDTAGVGRGVSLELSSPAVPRVVGCGVGGTTDGEGVSVTPVSTSPSGKLLGPGVRNVGFTVGGRVGPAEVGEEISCMMQGATFTST